jgi:hypothetical protein
MRFSKFGGLIGAGGVAQSFLSRMPALLAHVGPVKGASLHVSRRIANSLRAGTGVKDYSALAKCRVVFVSVPEDSLDRISRELIAAIPLSGKLIVLCDVFRDSHHPGPLHCSGARVGTLNSIPAMDEKVFVAEGHASVIAELERLLHLDRRKLISLKHGAKPLYLSGIHIADHLFLPWIAGAVENLRAAGFSRADATRTIRGLGWRSLRSYEKAGQKAWNPASAESLHQFVTQHLGTLRAKDRRMAILYSESVDRLLHFFEAPPRRGLRAKQQSAS